MNIYKNINDIQNIKNPAITIGTFDGVHLGHKEIFRQLLYAAGLNKSDHMIITFDAHPRKILNPGTPPRILTTTDEKIEEISGCGIENLLLLHFTRDIADLSPVEFMKKYIFSGMGIGHFVVGYDHAFGRNRDGDWEFLKNMSKDKGFGITRVDHLDFHSTPVSSTWIRAEIEDGNISLANSLLGRSYSFSGSVIKGDGRGRKLGFPTANIFPDEPDKVVPKDGVYAVTVNINGSAARNGMINIGTNPTFSRTEKTIEVNIFNFDEDVYGKMLEIHFHKRIRDEIKFDSPDKLIKQLQKDKSAVQKIMREPANIN